ncbi:MAG TPA: trimeric intracellular cation channel family protein [Ginsengibacter sp.]|nr:trimeric intracellular cation channel family protein [Ginsengibacter sp.]HRP17085.1 trimeric intracellular cation channel family protein [Ginsengibacter sp.]HRP43590.1 trimeric intracellular cation channel family protein [Ginsengibacter sp.]
MFSEYTEIIDVLGTIAFAVSGVYAALEKRLDLFGVVIIAFVTAIGGGTIRDLLIGDLPVTWIKGIHYTAIILATALVVILFRHSIRNFKKTLLVFDSLGLGLFTIVGIQKGIAFDLHPVVCVALGTITGCFGGVLRDMLLNNIPIIFHKEIYASACIAGGTVFFTLRLFQVNEELNESVSIVAVFLVRMLALRYDWKLPNLYRKVNRR